MSTMSVRVATLLLAASANARSLPQPTLTASAGGAARKDEHPLIRPVSGGLASCTAEICTLPIDRTKVMMQIATDSKGLVGTMRNVIEKEGAGALFKGAKPALLRQASYQSIKMALYEPIRDAVMRATSDDPNADPTLWQMILAGGIAGAVGTFLTSPTDLVKVRMQSGASYDSVSAAFADVYKDGGLTGLWAGWVPNCQRSFIVNAAELATCAARPPARPAPPRRRRPTTVSPARAVPRCSRRYDFFKLRLLKLGLSDGLLCQTLASFGAGFVAAAASTPVDRAKTLLMTRGAEYGGNMVSCLLKIAQDDGLAGLYRGFLATWMRIGPWAFLFFVCFEQFRNALNGLQALLEKPKAK